MYNKLAAEEFLVTYKKLSYSLQGAQQSLQYLFNSLQNANNTIEDTATNIKLKRSDEKKTAAIMDRIQTREHELVGLMDAFATIGTLTEDALLKMKLPEKYAHVPNLLRDKYVMKLSDKELLKKYRISKATLWRHLQIGYENFDVPDVDWPKLLD